MHRLPLVLLLVAVVTAGCLHDQNALDTDIDLEPFRMLARSGVACTEFVNRLFLIDGVFVFWHTEGPCPDSGYALTLYGSTPDDVRCAYYDSIAGPQRHCEDPAARPLFDIITAHTDEPDLGLGASHRVAEIRF